MAQGVKNQRKAQVQPVPEEAGLLLGAPPRPGAQAGRCGQCRSVPTGGALSPQPSPPARLGLARASRAVGVTGWLAFREAHGSVTW